MTTPQQNMLDLADIERQIDAALPLSSELRAARAVELVALFKNPNNLVLQSEAARAEQVYRRILVDLLNIPVGPHQPHLTPIYIAKDTP